MTRRSLAFRLVRVSPLHSDEHDLIVPRRFRSSLLPLEARQPMHHFRGDPAAPPFLSPNPAVRQHRLAMHSRAPAVRHTRRTTRGRST